MRSAELAELIGNDLWDRFEMPAVNLCDLHDEIERSIAKHLGDDDTLDLTGHRYAGLCPDETQPDSRDPECSMCAALTARAEAER